MEEEEDVHTGKHVQHWNKIISSTMLTLSYEKFRFMDITLSTCNIDMILWQIVIMIERDLFFFKFCIRNNDVNDAYHILKILRTFIDASMSY